MKIFSPDRYHLRLSITVHNELFINLGIDKHGTVIFLNHEDNPAPDTPIDPDVPKSFYNLHTILTNILNSRLPDHRYTIQSINDGMKKLTISTIQNRVITLAGFLDQSPKYPALINRLLSELSHIIQDDISKYNTPSDIDKYHSTSTTPVSITHPQRQLEYIKRDCSIHHQDLLAIDIATIPDKDIIALSQIYYYPNQKDHCCQHTLTLSSSDITNNIVYYQKETHCRFTNILSQSNAIEIFKEALLYTKSLEILEKHDSYITLSSKEIPEIFILYRYSLNPEYCHIAIIPPTEDTTYHILGKLSVIKETLGETFTQFLNLLSQL